MFFCQVTFKQSELGEKCHKIVVATRPRTYRAKVYLEETRSTEVVEVGNGTEIVKEISATERGVDIWNAMKPEEKQNVLNYWFKKN